MHRLTMFLIDYKLKRYENMFKSFLNLICGSNGAIRYIKVCLMTDAKIIECIYCGLSN